MRYEARALDQRLIQLNGISENQIRQHFSLYEGYVNKTNEIWGKLETVDRSSANQTYSDLRELKVELSFAWDGVKLHELYFENLGGGGGNPSDDVRKALEDSFGSYEKWVQDFKASGICARGWVITSFDPKVGKIFNYIADAHNLYGIWLAEPLLVLDTYEHAYMIDYGVKRPAYIDAFMNNIDWAPVARRLAEAQGK
ncbi:MAG: superoxide dismutase [Chloroflexota bacterium]|jgi:Fe-Mn family superoxide dismutase